MRRSTICALALLTALGSSLAPATPSDAAAGRSNPDWRGRLCANCQPETEAASRVRNEVRIATKLVAANTCADPGTSAWFAEEEDHVTAYLNSGAVRYK